MSESARRLPSENSAAPISFAARFAGSNAFNLLFAEATQLVEKTAAYLDGPGRVDSAGLRGIAALTFAQESTRLSTRLMRLMSWLLIRRAVADGDMTEVEAEQQRRKSDSYAEPPPPAETLLLLPEYLTDLIASAARLEIRMLHIDASEMADAPRPSPVRRELTLLKAAFGERPAPTRGKP